MSDLKHSTKYLTVKEVAQILNYHRATVYRKIQRKEIPSVKLGDTIRIPVSFLKKLEGE